MGTVTKWKNYHVAIFVLGCLLCDIALKGMARQYELPLWLDEIGTIVSAYFLGPVCGAMVGATTAIIYGILNPLFYAYGLVSIATGIIVGIFARKNFARSFFKSVSLSVLLTLVAVVISSPLNILFGNGSCTNKWGDGVCAFLVHRQFSINFGAIVGEFYVDFLDRLVSVLILYFIVKTIYLIKEPKIHKKVQKKIVKKLGQKATSIVLLTVIAGSVFAALSINTKGAPKADSLYAPVTISANSVSADSADGIVRDNNSYVQRIFSSHNGIPCGEANDIAQTSDGILWVGTYAGLYEYNGSEFVWRDDFGQVKSVNCLFVDEEGRLWIGTNDNGLSICINEKIAYTLDQSDGINSNTIGDIVKSSDGYYYIGTSDGISMVSIIGGPNVINKNINIGSVESMAADTRGYVAAVNSAGELYIIKDRTVITEYDISNAHEVFTCCYFDEEDRLFAGTSLNHVCEFQVNGGVLSQVKTISTEDAQYIKDIYHDEKSDKYYVCSDNAIGYFTYDGGYVRINTGAFNNSIDQILVDFQDNIWFTSSRLGLLCLCESNFKNYYAMAGLDDAMVNSVTMLDGLMYIATDQGLDIIDMETLANVDNDLTEAVGTLRIRCIIKDSKDNLWLCTYGEGIWKVSGSDIVKFNSTNSEVGNRVRLCKELSDGTIIVSSDQGLAYIKGEEVINSIPIGSDGFSSTVTLTLSQISDGTILAGTDGSGLYLIKNGKVVDHISRKDGLTSEVILRTVTDIDGESSFIVTSNGICYMDKDGNVKELPNIPYFNNFDITINEKGKLFILGSAGIYVVDRAQLLAGDEVSYTLLNSGSGLTGRITSNSWNYYDEDDKNLYISTDLGVFAVDTLSYSKGSKSYRMTVKEVTLNYVPYTIERGVPLNIGKDINRIEFVPEIINYTIENPYISYYLEGFDEQPYVCQLSNLSGAVYTNLEAGTYKFHIAVLDQEKGNVVEEGIYTIIIGKEIYDYPYFKIYMIFVLLLFIAWFIAFFVHMQIKKALTLKQKELELAKNQIEMGNQTILAIARTVDAKDVNTAHHSQRVSEYSVMIAQKLDFDEEKVESIRNMALLHDIGKIGIPDRVLNKPSKLDDEEYAIMKSHTVKGASILHDFTLVKDVAIGAHYHHERYDGKGYPEGLKGEDIPIEARIIGVADAFDAMTANRVYRKHLNPNYVIEEFKRCSGQQFDPELVEILLQLIDEKQIDIEAICGES